MSPSGFLHRRNGISCPPVPFGSRELAEADLGDVETLHDIVLAKMRPELFADEADGFFADHLERCGRILGLFAEDRLIAYGVLGIPGPEDINFGEMIGLPPEDRGRVAHIDGAAVLPAWRSNGLQRILIAWRLDLARRMGRDIALTTVAPENFPSLRNLLAEGMTIRALKQKFGGWRYILRRDLDIPQPVPPENVRWLDVTDVEPQIELLERGYTGWQVLDHKVSYARP